MTQPADDVCPVTGQAATSKPHRSALPATGPDVHFYHLYTDAPLPTPAGQRLPNSLPTLATRMCPPVTTASSLGYLLTVPQSFAVKWEGDHLWWALVDDTDGSTSDWQLAGEGRYGILHDRVAHMRTAVPPQRSEQLEEALEGGVPYLDPNPSDPREFQIISGVVATTAPGWAMLVRDVQNRPRPSGEYDIVEGVVETAWYGNTLPLMVRLRHEGHVVRFISGAAIATLLPIAVATYARDNASSVNAESGIEHWPDELWDRFVRTRGRRLDDKPASYKRTQREYYRDDA